MCAWHTLPSVSPAVPKAPSQRPARISEAQVGRCAGLPGGQNRGALSNAALWIGFPLPATAQTQSKSLSLQSQGFEAVMNEGFYPTASSLPSTAPGARARVGMGGRLEEEEEWVAGVREEGSVTSPLPYHPG